MIARQKGGVMESYEENKKIMKFFLITILLFLAVSSKPFAGGPVLEDNPDLSSTNQIILKLKNYEGTNSDIGISKSQLNKMEKAGRISLKRLREMSGRARVLVLPRWMDIPEVELITERIAGLDMVAYATPDRLMQPLSVIEPSDPRYPDQWHFFETAGGINLPGAWAKTSGSPNVVVAVIDTGILGDHEDLAGRWIPGYDFISIKFNARDGDRRDGDPSDEGDWKILQPSSWHGTHVAGIIGAETNNGTGVAGVDWQCRILPVRVLGRLGGFTSDIVDGMRWAVGLSVPNVPKNTTPANVVNMSLGGMGTCNAAWQEAVDDVIAQGAVIVIAAGNSNDDASAYTPGNCQDVITVAATDRTGDLAWYSNFGTSIEISAPGGETYTPVNGVLSTLNTGLKQPMQDTYAYYQGTSMAAPHVSGVISLMLSLNPDLTLSEILTIIQETARPFPTGACFYDPDLCGAGIIDAEAAINAIGADSLQY